MKLFKGVLASIAAARRVKPTIVLVHGAMEDGSAWNGVSARL